MNKNVLIRIVAFGGLLLIVAKLPDTNSSEENNVQNTEEVVSLPTSIPVNVPIYPESQVQNSRESSSETSDDIFCSFPQMQQNKNK